MSKRVVFSGRVQGVGFRWHIKRCAEKHNIDGWVKNQDDGAVLVLCDGKTLDEFINCCERGNEFSEVMHAHVEDSDEKIKQDNGFEIRL